MNLATVARQKKYFPLPQTFYFRSKQIGHFFFTRIQQFNKFLLHGLPFYIYYIKESGFLILEIKKEKKNPQPATGQKAWQQCFLREPSEIFNESS